MPTVTVPKAIDDGLHNLKANFWPFMLIIIILGILESMGNGSAVRNGMTNGGHFIFGPFTGGFFAFLIAFFVKPVLDFGAKLIFVKANLGEEVDVREMIQGFDSKPLYIDIILTNVMVVMSIIVGMICLILPGIYVACRVVLAPYLVMDKGLAPQQAYKASWKLTENHWAIALQLGVLSFIMILAGVALLIVGMIPAFAWVKAMFASFYQQVLDAHDEDFLLSLDIEP